MKYLVSFLESNSTIYGKRAYQTFGDSNPDSFHEIHYQNIIN